MAEQRTDERVTRLEAMYEHVATKADLQATKADLQQEIGDVKIDLRQEIGEVKVDLAALERRSPFPPLDYGVRFHRFGHSRCPSWNPRVTWRTTYG